MNISVEKQAYSELLVPCYFSALSACNVLPLVLHQRQQIPDCPPEFIPGLTSLETLFLLPDHPLPPRKRYQASLLWSSIEFPVYSHDSNFSWVSFILPLLPSFREQIRSYLLQGILTIIYVPYFLTVSF